MTTTPFEHSFFTTLNVASADEAESRADEACRAYFGDQPFKVSLSTCAIVTTMGTVTGYHVTVSANALTQGEIAGLADVDKWLAENAGTSPAR